MRTQRNFNMQCTDDSGEYDGDYDLYASDTDESEGETAVAHAKDAPEWMPINGVQFSERDRSQWPHTDSVPHRRHRRQRLGGGSLELMDGPRASRAEHRVPTACLVYGGSGRVSWVGCDGVSDWIRKCEVTLQ